MYILGISCYYHDSAAAIIKDGILIAASEEERLSRIKHDSSFPKKAIEFCLKKADIKSQDLDYVVFYEKPFLKFERTFLNSIEYSPKSLGFFKESMKKWFFDHLWIKSQIMSELRIPPKKLLFCEHHLSHAASAFFCSPFEKSAVLTVDGVGEWTTASWGVGQGNKINLIEEIRFPHSLGLLYSVFTDFVGFEVNEGEYKTMGLAPYGKPKYIDEIYKILSISEDGSFKLNLDFFSYHYSLKKIYTEKFENIFGIKNKKKNNVVAYYADIAASIQKVLEQILIDITKYIHKKTGNENLSFAGGVALNSVANWKIFQNSGFKHIYIQPAAGDSGGALGAALWAYRTVLNGKNKFVLNNAYYGEEESVEEIEKTLRNENIKYQKVNENKLIELTAQYLSKGKVVGWVQGRYEWGPRALGNRSILADPRDKKMKNLVNSKIKFREEFRPFAPVTTAEDSDKYFDIDSQKSEFPFKFMLYVVNVKDKKRQELGAVTHEDGTARPQFVDKKVNPKYYKLIKSFGKITGTPVLLNTSFNLKGEPIVNTASQALGTFYKSGLDVLVIDNFLVKK